MTSPGCIGSLLVAAVRRTPSIRVMEGYAAEQLRAEGQYVTGLVARDRRGWCEDEGALAKQNAVQTAQPAVLSSLPARPERELRRGVGYAYPWLEEEPLGPHDVERIPSAPADHRTCRGEAQAPIRLSRVADVMGSTAVAPRGIA